MLSACVPSACAVSPRNSAVVIGVPISLDDVSGMVQAIFTCSSRFTQSLTLPRLSRISSPQPTRDPRAEQGEFVDPACELEQQENAESEQPKCHGGFIPKPARRRPWSRVVQRPGRPRSASAALQPRHTNQGSSPRAACQFTNCCSMAIGAKTWATSTMLRSRSFAGATPRKVRGVCVC